jgi:hypothetical protein
MANTKVDVTLKNPSVSPSGLPADLVNLVGRVVCKTKEFPISPTDFNFQTNIARLPVVAGEYCVAVISSMTLKVRGSSTQITYAAEDKPLQVPLSSDLFVQPNAAAEDTATQFLPNRVIYPLPEQLWFANQTSQGERPTVGIDISRAKVIKNVKSVF